MLASAEIPTGRCGSREPPTGLQTRHFAISLTAPRSVSENPMECRSPRPMHVLADGEGGFWVGGQTSLVHWRAGVSQVYPIEGLKSNAGDVGINSLVRGADGSLWVGIAAAGPGLGLGRFRDGVFRPFVTPTFDGSKLRSTT